MAVEIRDLGHDAYLVDGEVIWIKENAIDAHTEAGRSFLIKQAEYMKSDNPLDFCRVYGPLTMELVFPKRHSTDDALYVAGPGHYRSLPKEVFPEYASEI